MNKKLQPVIFFHSKIVLQPINYGAMSMGFPGGTDGRESACSVGDPGLIPGSGKSPREGNGNPLQYSFLGYPMDRGDW